MATPHSTVKYVEPNMNLGFSTEDKNAWFLMDDYDRAPRLEDYCIALNIEVEISSRDGQSSLDSAPKDVIILQWKNNDNEKISFMAGTKIGGYDINGTNRTPRISSATDNLTTYYADMYVGDLIDYGTTEMIGIKSVDIEYMQSCVPVITVKFTDVRGLSLFQPTELSRDNSYNGIKGLNKDNIAQSFFQCFFKMPLPKFTIFIKGFYGNPVSYVMMCDKFDTNFNSSTGDFDVTARFIGYSYSFLTDVSLETLIAAPYADFGDCGKQYWDDNVKNGRFFIWDKLNTQKMKMPTLLEIYSDFRKLVKDSNKEMENTTLTDEEITHNDEINTLNELRQKYQAWYESLFILLKERYGKRYCFDFKDNEKNLYRILILTNSKTVGVDNLAQDYTQYPEEFKTINNNLYASIEEFNSSGNSYKKLKNISKDFSEYTRVNLFNNCYVNRNTRKIEFGGFNRSNKLSENQVVNRLFHELEKANENNSKSIKDFTLSTIYGDGVDQYKDAYVIEVDYSDISRRISVLNADKNKSLEAKEREKARKEHNRIMMGNMNWYPSIENFTKVMMAHLETYMMMMYKVSDACTTRTLESLNVSSDVVCDVNPTSKTIPPFPRVVHKEVGDDNITKTVDTWIGELNDGQGFIEADLVNSLFNAVDYIDRLRKENDEEIENMGKSEEMPKLVVKHPLTSFDFFLTKNVYGSESDVANDPNAFIGKIAMRMFNILSLNSFRWQYDKWSHGNGDFMKKLGEIEAVNFYDSVKITNNKLLSILGIHSDSSQINPSSFTQCIINGTSIDGGSLPWKKDKNDQENLFDKNYEMLKYKTSLKGDNVILYPSQNMSFSAMAESLKIFNNSDKIDFNNDDIITDSIKSDKNLQNLLSSKNKSYFGSMFISDDYSLIAKAMDMSNSSADNVYKDVYDVIYSGCTMNPETYGSFIYDGGVFIPKLNLNTSQTVYNYKDDDPLTVHKNETSNTLQISGGTELKYGFDTNKVNDYVTEAQNKKVTSWFLSECRGFDYDSKYNKYKKSNDKSLFLQKNAVEDIKKSDWGVNNGDANRKVGFFLMGLEAINYTELSKHLNSNETFTYLPKLAVLQIGAALASLGSMKSNIDEKTFENKIILPNTFGSIIPYLNAISDATKVSYMRYFRDWVFKHSSEINLNLYGNDKKRANACIACRYKLGRAVFKEDSEFINYISNELMSIVCLAKGNAYHFKRLYGTTELKYDFKLSEGVINNYVTGFLDKLREFYGVETKFDSNGIKISKDPTKVNNDLRKELYRYLKLVYDKWIPSTNRESWKFETFFDSGKEKAIIGNRSEGHLFHFIDSYYNKIGDKLIINPRTLCDKIEASFDAKDVNTMMLGFMADIFGLNKCMFVCIQNFLDLAKDESMNVMFRPIPYNAMPTPNKHPDFVIVYPYEPSKYLNIDNGEYNNDSFMLNDEFETPIAIRSRGAKEDDYYKIPAFGVSYGKQYQSYFKNVNVGMASPIATQQAILAKHAILRQSQDGKTKTTVGQDLYDVYSTQSYTCTVDMMGCAWIQPLMYFVLTNIPMFRGSYLIFKVTHKITPGDMTTSFQGTRMANVSNKLIEEIFTDEDLDGDNFNYESNLRYQAANVDNDCPYKVYPLFEDENSGNDVIEAQKAMTSLMRKGFSKYAAAGICGNIFKESTWSLHKVNGIGAFGLCQWTSVGRRKEILFEKYGKLPTFENQMEYIAWEWDNESLAKSHKNELNAATTPEKAAYIVREHFERPREWEADDTTRSNKAREYFDKFGTSVQNKDTVKPNNKDIYECFKNAVQKSLSSTNSNVTLKMEKNKHGIYGFTQEGGKTDKLPMVFDIILNGYYEYVQKLWWISPSGDLTSNPSRISFILSEKVEPNKRMVIVSEDGKAKEYESKKFGGSSSALNEKLLKSIYKKYNQLPNNDVPQFDSQDIFKDVNIQDCNTLMSNMNGNSSGRIEGFQGDVTNPLMKKVLSDVNHINSKKLGTNYEIKFNDYSGCCTSGPTTWYNRAEPNLLNADSWWSPEKVSTSNYKSTKAYFNKKGFKCVWYGDKENAIKLNSSNLRPGDICTLFAKRADNTATSHGAMWTGHDWRSDAIQKGIWIYGNGVGREGNKSVCIWRHPKFQEPGMEVNEVL